MDAKYFLVPALLVLTCVFQDSGAAITPVDETYTAIADEDFSIPWVFDNKADLDQIFWYYKSSSSSTTIMSKIGAASATVFNNFNVEHVSDGIIKLKSVTKEYNAGIYYCQVSYTLGSSLPTVTGTATLSVTSG